MKYAAETLKVEEFCNYAKFIKECQNKKYAIRLPKNKN